MKVQCIKHMFNVLQHSCLLSDSFVSKHLSTTVVSSQEFGTVLVPVNRYSKNLHTENFHVCMCVYIKHTYIHTENYIQYANVYAFIYCYFL